MVLSTPRGLFQKQGKSTDVGPMLCKVRSFTLEAGPQTVVMLLRVESMEFLTQAYGA